MSFIYQGAMNWDLWEVYFQLFQKFLHPAVLPTLLVNVIILRKLEREVNMCWLMTQKKNL